MDISPLLPEIYILELLEKNNKIMTHKYAFYILLSSFSGTMSTIIYFNKHSQGITSMLGYTIPIDTTHVRFQHNLITMVTAGYYSNLPDLDTIYLHDNRICNISSYAFIGVPSTKAIQLYQNKLTVVRKHMFAGLINLR